MHWKREEQYDGQYAPYGQTLNLKLSQFWAGSSNHNNMKSKCAGGIESICTTMGEQDTQLLMNKNETGQQETPGIRTDDVIALTAEIQRSKAEAKVGGWQCH